MKLGSLFDGSGGFPLAGFMCGIEPIWASEVEPYPIAVTKSRFPHMKHLGDISKINGAEIEPVDIITFGSPCQDLSVAGKRAGLKHEENGDDETTRSGLFMEAVRIIKEMREKTNGQYPRFAVWENVPGAFSSNKGEDFKIVLEELIKIASPSAVMPEVPRFGWAYADSYSGDGWSLAYRVLDAQYWGVPQRRRRIYLVADFTGQCARKILFEREGLRGYFTEGRTPWQEAPTDAERSIGADDRTGAIPYTLKIRSGCEGGGKGALIQKNKSATLSCNNDQYLFQPVAYSFDALSSNSMKSSNPHSGCREVNVARTIDTSNPDPSKNQGGIAIVEPKAAAYGVVTKGNGDAFISKERHTSLCSGGGQAGQGYPCVMQSIGADIYNLSATGDTVGSLTAGGYGSTGTSPKLILPVLDEPCDNCVGCYDARGNGDGKTVNTLTGDHENRITDYTSVVVYSVDQGGGKSSVVVKDNQAPTLTCTHDGSPAVVYQDKIGTLYAGDSKIGNQYVGQNKLIVEPYEVSNQYIVRRLTPTECARLQGFADRWGDIDTKTEFSNEEYAFWLDVRNTHAAINGKQVKEYTKKQMLTWYNKLNTDGAEYKMWGNGIALPTALYVMQGIKEASNESYQN